MNTAASLYGPVAAALAKYLDERAAFGDMEASIADVIRAHPGSRGLMERLYHVVNHYEADVDLRDKDAQYAQINAGKLRQIASALGSGSSEEIDQAIAAFW